jgi:hypothetical protein
VGLGRGRAGDRHAGGEEQVVAFERLARELGESTTLTARHLQRLASGKRSGEHSNPSTRRVMKELYRHSLDVLLGSLVRVIRGATAGHA